MKRRVLVLLAALSAPAFAQQDFDALDLNRDGALTLSESRFDPRIALNFERLDRDRNGLLSAREYRLLLL